MSDFRLITYIKWTVLHAWVPHKPEKSAEVWLEGWEDAHTIQVAIGGKLKPLKIPTQPFFLMLQTAVPSTVQYLS